MSIRAILFLLLLAGVKLDVASADSWLPVPEHREFVSQDGKFRLRLDGSVGRLESGSTGNWVELWSRSLLNVPYCALVSNEGFVATLDEWGTLGRTDNVLVIYGSNGRVIRRMGLDEMVGSEYLSRFPRTVSSTMWGSSAVINEETQTIEIVLNREHTDVSKDHYLQSGCNLGLLRTDEVSVMASDSSVGLHDGKILKTWGSPPKAPLLWRLNQWAIGPLRIGTGWLSVWLQANPQFDELQISTACGDLIPKHTVSSRLLAADDPPCSAAGRALSWVISQLLGDHPGVIDTFASTMTVAASPGTFVFVPDTERRPRRWNALEEIGR